jgi:hypothetical protein
MKKIIFLTFVFLFGFIGLAQNTEVKGVIIENGTNKPIQSVKVSIVNTVFSSITNSFGKFTLSNVPKGKYEISFTVSDYKTVVMNIEAKGNTLDIGTIILEKDATQDLKDNLVSIIDTELDDEDNGADNTSGLLQATRDIYMQRAAFDFGQAFFRVRGYDNAEGQVTFNGMPMNKISTGRPQWNQWGGLNDVTRMQTFTNGLAASDYTFGGILGNTEISTRASRFRPGLRISQSGSNRTYAGRTMATYNSGLIKNKITFSISASRRWAEEGYIEGTIYDAYSVFGALEYKINENHSLNATAFYAPNRRGASQAITEEHFLLKGRQYNPNLGIQNGEDRNAAIVKNNEPIFQLTHFYANNNFKLTTSFGYQTGFNSRGRLGFQRANNPSPIYYRKLPSYALNYLTDSNGLPNYAEAQRLEAQFLANPYINFNELYAANQGRKSHNYLYADRNDENVFTISSLFNKQISDKLKLDGGVSVRDFRSNSYGDLTDLLGGSHFEDYNDFDNIQNNIGGQLKKQVGDKILYNYNIYSVNFNSFLQLQANFKYIDFFVSGSYGYTSFRREGLFNNELHSNSLGKGPKVSFQNYAYKAGFTYKITSQHLLNFNGMNSSRAQQLRTIFPNVRISGDVSPNVSNEIVTSFDGSYILRMPKIKARATGFYTKFQNSSRTSFFFGDFGGEGEEDDFFSENIVGLDKQHIGVELGIEYQITPTIKLSAAGTLSQFTYLNNDAKLLLFADDPDNGGLSEVKDFGNLYFKDFRVAAGPQTAASLGIEYRDPRYWWVGATANFLGDNYVDISGIRRSEQFFINQETGNYYDNITQEENEKLLKQEKFKDIYLVNLVGGKSWRFKSTFISLFASVNNLFDITFRTGGFEQGRNASLAQMRTDNANNRPSFGNRYFYGFGRTYFVNLAVSL